MRVIITGGTGLIGKEIANSLAHDHHEVIVLSRNTNKTSGLAPGIRVVAWDSRTSDGWAHLADGAGAIINLAGESISGESFLPERWSAEKKKRILDSRVQAGQAVVEAIDRAKVKPQLLIQASAVGYYGSTGDAPVTEDSPAGDGFLADVCKQWEASTAAVEAMGVRRVILRIGLPLSMQGGVFTRLIFPFRLFAGGPLGSGQQYQPWIHMDDMVAIVQYLMENNQASGAFNISAPAPVTNAELAKAIGRVMKRPSFLPAPAIAFKLGFGEVAEIVLEGNKMIPKRLMDMGFKWAHPHVGEAVADLLGAQKAPTAPAHH